MRDLTELLGQQGLNWYAIINGTKEKSALIDYYRLGGHDATAIWSGTPYEDWKEVMPYIAPVDKTGDFPNWIQQEAEEDWGMLVGSHASFEQLHAHFRSLTQVWLPSGSHVFFRFYDPRFSLDVANYCDEKLRALVMGPARYWAVKGRFVENASPKIDVKEQAFPWWTVPETVIAQLSTDKSVLEVNLVKGAVDTRPDITQFYPEQVLAYKASRFAQKYQGDIENALAVFIDSLAQEQQRLGNIS